MEDLAMSIMRFSSAMTMFGIQQVQNSMEAFTDPQTAQKKFARALNSVSEALTAELDEPNKSTEASISGFGEKIVNRTMSAIDVPAWDPKNVMKAASDIVKKTTDSMTTMVEKASDAMSEAADEITTEKKPKASEPKAAAEALGKK
ncbi:MAG: hypothetical protein R2729_11000 [Bryobacteraceae bacterium]